MFQSPAMRAMTRDIAAGVEICRKECDYFSVCGGGAPINKLTENGSFATGRTMFCNLIQIVPTDLILNAMDRVEADFDGMIACASHLPDSEAKYQFRDAFAVVPDPVHADAAKFGPNTQDAPIHQSQRGSR